MKLAMGDVRGAVNLVTSKESILPPSEETKLRLQARPLLSQEIRRKRLFTLLWKKQEI